MQVLEKFSYCLSLSIIREHASKRGGPIEPPDDLVHKVSLALQSEIKLHGYSPPRTHKHSNLTVHISAHARIIVWARLCIKAYLVHRNKRPRQARQLTLVNYLCRYATLAWY